LCQELGQDYDSTGFFQFLLGIIGGIFADLSHDNTTGGLSHGLGFAKSKVGQLADGLDDFDLLRAGFFDDDIKFGLSAAAAADPPAAATATGAAAETPQASSSFLTSSAASITLSLPSSSTNLFKSDISNSLFLMKNIL
jgi:hypothetical protein